MKNLPPQYPYLVVDASDQKPSTTAETFEKVQITKLTPYKLSPPLFFTPSQSPHI
jgi:hypothetical protein